MRWDKRPRGSEGGQTLIEFALIMPIVFLFLFVLVDFGIAMDRRLVLQHAVREGARYAAVVGANPVNNGQCPNGQDPWFASGSARSTRPSVSLAPVTCGLRTRTCPALWTT